MKIDKRRFELQEKSNIGWIRTPYVKDLENIGEAQDCLRTYMKNIDFANIQLRLREIGDNSEVRDNGKVRICQEDLSKILKFKELK
jgi:hypothetical protein